jgi:DnaJ-class molecular chaperone
MKDYFKTLELPNTATQAEIKDAYRKLALKYHPDRNGGDKAAEEKFKQVAEAYDVLSKQKGGQSSGHNAHQNDFVYGFKDFDDFKKTFNDGFRGRKKQAVHKDKTYSPPPDPQYLNIELTKVITLKEVCTGTSVNIEYTRTKIEYTGSISNRISYKKVEEEKVIKINLDFKQKKFKIEPVEGGYLIMVSASQLGNEDIVDYKNILDEYEQIPLKGDLIIKIIVKKEEDYYLEGNNIIQVVQVPLYKLLKTGEKIRIETLFDKKYDAEVYLPTSFSGLKFIVDGQGILGEEKKVGDYIVRFEVITPNIEKLKKSERDQFLNLLKEI